MKLLNLKQVASVLGKKEWDIKNWISGKPFNIHPSVLKAQGTGSRNLYGEEDLWKFEIVDRAVKAGVRNDPVRFILEKLEKSLKEEGYFDKLKKSKWILLNNEGNTWNIKIGESGKKPPTIKVGILQYSIDTTEINRKLEKALKNLEE